MLTKFSVSQVKQDLAVNDFVFGPAPYRKPGQRGAARSALRAVAGLA
jgi:hypothetical protein